MLRLAKFHSYGNAYLAGMKSELGALDQSLLARRASDPHFGIGSDGLVTVEPLGDNRFELQVFNPDGSQAEMSGNGGRCAAAFIHARKLSSSRQLIFETAAGGRAYERLDAFDDGRMRYRSKMGRPSFVSSDIPMEAGDPHRDREVLDVPFRLGSRELRIAALTVGNPQCVVLEAAGMDWREVGAKLSKDPVFPGGTNVSFLLSAEAQRIEIRIWERGVGPTCSSGTGCCGAAVASLALGLVKSPVSVVTETGTQVVEWNPGEEIRLTGDVWSIAEVLLEPAALL